MGSPSTTTRAITSIKSETSYKSPPSTVSDTSQHDADDKRGRTQQRDRSSTAKAEDESGDDERNGSVTNGGKPRKRKRSRKGLEKSFACPFQDCGRSYSRAEHLYRHQLNHDPKQIYRCDHPGCEREFVRQDLCARHQERHTARGSHLQRRDYALHGSDSVGSTSANHNGLSENTGRGTAAMLGRMPLNGREQESYHAGPGNLGLTAHQRMQSPGSLAMTGITDYSPTNASLKRSYSDEQYYLNAQNSFETGLTLKNASSTPYDIAPKEACPTPPKFARLQKANHAEAYRPRPPLNLHTDANQGRPSSASSYDSFTMQNAITPGNAQSEFAEEAFPQDGFHNPLNLPPPSYASVPAPLQTSNAVSSMEPTTGYDRFSNNGMTGLEPTLMDSSNSAYSVPLWNSDPYGNVSRNTAEDFVKFLFSEQAYGQGLSPGGPRQESLSFDTTAFMEDINSTARGPYGLSHEMLNRGAGQNVVQQHPMALNSILDPASLHAILSDEKRRMVLNLIESRFTDNAPVAKQREDLFVGDVDAEGHVLSLRQMQLYVRSYWYHFHPQMPILHKPTFSADNAENLLLIAVIAIGASCLDKVHGADVTQAGADLSNFLVWHLRGEIFKHTDFSPPAQLWVFQSLLLLEVYEKMYSTRVLHERAHIHHGTTLTLMRRGSSLIGKSSLDSPPNEKTGPDSTLDPQGSATSTPEQWWTHWITNEATRRVAFAAYIIDSIHATMFGHQATMVAHEMKLALPCDEALWSATSSAEVAKKEADLRAKGVKTMTFFDGLKNTLKGKPVQTNAFGRMAIMAGLLSVTWHMNQRDVQIHHLGALRALGGKDVWRGPLTKAFDSWKLDFDSSMSKEKISLNYSAARLDEENIFESRTVLHHLSHMAMHVDVVNCQIFAGAGRLLGRTTLQSDYEIAQKRIRVNWAPRASARHATFYALKFLTQVLMPDASPPYASQMNSTPYSARDDFLLNRPWVLYYAALVVWSYGYALDGPLKNPPTLSTPDEQAFDMRHYLGKFGGIQAPPDLCNMRDRNACLGLLYVLRDRFKQCRWQLLHEAAILLGNCIEKLRGSDERVK